MSAVGKLFAIAAIFVLVLGVSGWQPSGAGQYVIYNKNRGFSFPLDYWAFSIGAIFAVFAAVYYWFPILSSRSLGIRLSQLHFWLSALAAFGFLFLAPGFGAVISPRDTALSSQRPIIAVLGIAIISAILFLVAQFIFVVSFFWSAINTKKL